MVRLRSSDTVKSTQAKFLVHTMQIIPQKFCKTFDTQKILPVSSENDTLHHFRVEVNLIYFSVVLEIKLIFLTLYSKIIFLKFALQNIGQISEQQH